MFHENKAGRQPSPYSVMCCGGHFSTVLEIGFLQSTLLFCITEVKNQFGEISSLILHVLSGSSVRGVGLSPGPVPGLPRKHV